MTFKEHLRTFTWTLSAFFILALSGCGKSNKANNSNSLVPNIDVSKVDESDCKSPFLEKRDLESNIRFADAACVKKIVNKFNVDLNKPLVDVFGDIGPLPLEFALEDSSLFFTKDKHSPALIPALLISLGANPNAKTAKGYTILELAMGVNYGLYGSVPHYLIELKQIELNTKGMSGTPLEYSIALKNEAFIEQLINRGADVNLMTRGNAPLISALNQGLESSSLKLIDAGADLSAVTYNKDTALHLALNRNFDAVTKKIIGKKLGINAQNEDGVAPLHIAAEKGKDEITDYLIKSGAQIEISDSKKRTPLFLATNSGRASTVEILLSFQASTSVTDIENRSLVQIAPSSELALRLLSAGAPADTLSQTGESPLSVHTTADRRDVVKALKLRGANLQWKDKTNRSLLHLAANSNAFQTAEYLLSEGLAVDTEDNGGNSALFETQSIAMLSVLVKYRTKIDLMNNAGKTALSKHVLNLSYEMTRGFLDRGADVNWGRDQGTSYLIELLRYSWNRSPDEGERIISMANLLLSRGVEHGRPEAVTGHPAIHYLFVNKTIFESASIFPFIEVFRDAGANLHQMGNTQSTLRSLAQTELQSSETKYKFFLADAERLGDKAEIERLKSIYEPLINHYKEVLKIL